MKKYFFFFLLFLFLISCNFKRVKDIIYNNNIVTITNVIATPIKTNIGTFNISKFTLPINFIFYNDSIINYKFIKLKNYEYYYTHIPHVDSSLFYADLGIKEIGDNSGFNNKYFQNKIYEEGWRRGAAWCAYSVKVFLKMGKAVYPINKGGMAQGFIKNKSISAKSVTLGKDTVGVGFLAVWKHGRTSKGHVGIVYKWNKYSGIVIEGNTTSGDKGNQRNGWGEYIRIRKIEPRNYFRITNFTPVFYN